MIDLLLDVEQQSLVDSFTTFLRAEAPVGTTPHVDFWGQIAALGWLSFTLPDEAGGAGLGPVEEMLLMRECGRQLLTPSFMATLVALRIVHDGGEQSLSADLASGNKRAAFAVRRDADSFYILDGSSADFALTWEDAGVAVYPLREPLEPLTATDNHMLSMTRLRKPLLASKDVLPARLMVAAQLTGIAEAVRDMATEQAKMRKQFGQPIGAFQAVKHTCADLAIRAEAACAQLCYAALCAAERTAEAQAEVAAAVHVACQAAIVGAEANVQLHGAMGITEECHAHLYLKRAHLWSFFDGRAGWQKSALLGL